MIIIEGKAEHPVYLFIKDDQVEIRSAEAYWGKLVSETIDGLLEEVGESKAKVVSIGPAGERLSLIAAIMAGKDRATGRSGVGAVMGSKNLKAIVVKGSKGVEVARPEEMKKYVNTLLKRIKENPVTGQGLPQLGTPILVKVISAHGILPT